MTKRSPSVVFGASVIALAIGLALGAGTPAQRCAASKLKETGKKASGQLKCWSKEVVRPGVLSQCLAKAETNFNDKWAKAEATGGCASLNDRDDIENKVEAFIDDVVTALTVSPTGALLTTDDARKCAGSKLRAAGQKTSSKLKCHSKATIIPPLDPECLTKATNKFNRKWDSAESKGG